MAVPSDTMDGICRRSVSTGARSRYRGGVSNLWQGGQLRTLRAGEAEWCQRDLRKAPPDVTARMLLAGGCDRGSVRDNVPLSDERGSTASGGFFGEGAVKVARRTKVAARRQVGRSRDRQYQVHLGEGFRTRDHGFLRSGSILPIRRVQVQEALRDIQVLVPRNARRKRGVLRMGLPRSRWRCRLRRRRR